MLLLYRNTRNNQKDFWTWILWGISETGALVELPKDEKGGKKHRSISKDLFANNEKVPILVKLNSLRNLP